MPKHVIKLGKNRNRKQERNKQERNKQERNKQEQKTGKEQTLHTSHLTSHTSVRAPSAVALGESTIDTILGLGLETRGLLLLYRCCGGCTLDGDVSSDCEIG